ncbi:putative UvrD/REP helicase [Actinoplanes missouriensis 431]|uniref:DNA 3'-5' helicase n=1 Tax=Actinoplanes missouriensis (strain ATCC 14538 / DSM 43046 / CBS 188.64 / JCM 3121 / NBRC 102363 / NCIMB 12654 / NRRL B-3342 / UNCC 431) TaxID=512565 RepID=I0HJV4_ACTM4|nr:UvrD-helicase domain-containing protein [Actinoplanes missouriensis]BAL93291.1 putative UvrD/REP helicase [Actinoplanes missouriensis 431]
MRDVESTAGTYVADLHIHSRYSRACSRDLTLPNLAWWARRKGIALLGTGDFTHPAWFEHLKESLKPAEPGLFRLAEAEEQAVTRRLPGSLSGTAPARFMLSVEISTIYKRDDRTRKVHHLLYAPDFASVQKINTALARIGNLTADGRPILGLDSRDLLEITLESGGYLIPAHIWTPWFSALGSKSGFDAIADCYADLADHVTAVETGLSSDPEMNWRVSSLDRYRLVSNSDAHSPAALAREATLFSGTPDYFAVKDGVGLAGTIEFFPEEGKYHADGHRACGVNWEPSRTREAAGRCPECGRPLTIGVQSRVEDLADRPVGFRKEQHVEHLIQLHEILGEINGVGPKSKTVEAQLNHLVATLGPELEILRHVPVDEIGKAGGEELREAITRLRRGDVRRVPGYDGEYGVITLFEPGELRNRNSAPQVETLFDMLPASVPNPPKPKAAPEKPKPKAAKKPAEKPAPPPLAPPPSPHEPFEPMLAGMEEVGTGLLDRLDAMQRVAASAPGGPLLIVAGPGTGKTRTLTHRIAYLCAELGVFPERCLAITFTRRAATELKERLDALLGDVAEDITVGTFHSLGLTVLKENAKAAGLGANWRIADEHEQAQAREQAGTDDAGYRKLLRQQDLVDLDDLISLPVTLLREDPALVERYRRRWQWIFVDEYQDVDELQYELLRLLSPPDGNLCAIGDPDQAIYSFRGADVRYFLRFNTDFVDARLVRLTRNYRSSAPILAAAVQAIAPSTLVSGRRLDPARLDPEAPLVGRYPARSVSDEADFVVRTIDELVGGLSHRSLDSGRVDSRAAVAGTLSFSDVAVLYRTDAQSGPILDALSRAGVPVQKRSHNRLRHRPGVQVIARELRHADGSGGPLAARVRLAAQTLAQRYATPTLDGDQLAPEDVWSAADLLAPLAERVGDDLPQFLQQLETGAEVDALDPRAEAVNLLTLHAAKGLEFPVVFLVGCEDGLLPLRWPGSTPTDDEIAEERRLFFVGLTRAQDRLYVSYSAKRSRHGSEREQAPTPFLDVIDSGLFERLGEAAPAKPKDRQLRLL